MTADVQKIMTAIMRDILQEIHAMYASEIGINTKTGYNTLQFSGLEVNTKGELNDDTINIEFPHYIVFIEWDRPPKYGKKPPYDAILKWLKEKGIRPTVGNIHTVEQLAWVLRYAIWRDGWDRRIIAGLNRDYTGQSPLDNFIDNMWSKKWGDELFDIIMKEINRYFDN